MEDKKKIESIIVKDDVDTLVCFAEVIGRELSDVSKSQIRSLFDSIKRLEMEGVSDSSKLVLLKPKIEYAVSRTGGLERFGKILSEAIDVVSEQEEFEEAFERFMNFFEAVLCYYSKYKKRS